MFWQLNYASTSQIDTILGREEGFTLDQLLDVRAFSVVHRPPRTSHHLPTLLNTYYSTPGLLTLTLTLALTLTLTL